MMKTHETTKLMISAEKNDSYFKGKLWQILLKLTEWYRAAACLDKKFSNTFSDCM